MAYRLVRRRLSRVSDSTKDGSEDIYGNSTDYETRFENVTGEF